MTYPQIWEIYAQTQNTINTHKPGSESWETFPQIWETYGICSQTHENAHKPGNITCENSPTNLGIQLMKIHPQTWEYTYENSSTNLGI